MHLICREFKDKIIYVNKYLRRRYTNLKSKEITYLLDYGFIYDNGNYILKNPSRVKYPDGRIREWQGRKYFTYDDIINYNSKTEKEGD